MRAHTVLKLILELDRLGRRHNYEEMQDRVRGNIQDFENRRQRNAEAQDRAEENLAKNEQRLKDAVESLARIQCPKTQEWLQRTERKAVEHSDPEKRRDASQKVKAHYEKVHAIQMKVEKFQAWVNEDRRRLDQCANREQKLNSKISSSWARLRN